jgi:hypothetical protein
MGQKNILLPDWRRRILEDRLLPALVALELVLSVVFLLIGYRTGTTYFRGVGIGLVIAWVTGGVAYLFKSLLVKT